MNDQIVAPERSKVNRKQRQIEFNDILKRWAEYYKADTRILVNYLYSLGHTPTYVARILGADPDNFRRDYPKQEDHEA